MGSYGVVLVGILIIVNQQLKKRKSGRTKPALKLNLHEGEVLSNEENETLVFGHLPTPSCSSLTSPPRVFQGVGGHASKNRGPNMLSFEGYILKPFQDFDSTEDDKEKEKDKKRRVRGQMEAEFYSRVWETNHPIKAHQPKYFGVKTMSNGNLYLVLEDLTYGFDYPCVLDLKMGRRSYDEEASPEKVAKEKAKYPPQEKVGFRFSGMRVYQLATGDWVQSTREWCLSLEQHQIPDALERFFFDGRVVRRDLVRSVINQVFALAKCLEDHPTWRMYGASLLICYDGGSRDDTVKVKLIDFSHCYEIQDEGGKDFGFLHGTYFLLSSLNDILDRGRRNVTRRNSLVDTASRLIVQASEKFEEETSSSTPPQVQAVYNGHDINPVSNIETVMEASSPVDAFQSDPHLAPLIRHMKSDDEDSRRMKRRTRSLQDVTSLDRSDSPPVRGEERVPKHQRSPSENFQMASKIEYSPVNTEGIHKLANSHSKVSELVIDEVVEVKEEETRQRVGGAHNNILLMNDGTIIKEEVDKEHFDKEANFYRNLGTDTFAKVTPALINIDESSTPRRMILEDITTLVVQPNSPAAHKKEDEDNTSSDEEEKVKKITFNSSEVNIMDIKMGRRSFCDDAPNEPKSSYYEKYEKFVKELPPGVVENVWQLIVGSEAGPKCLKEKLLGKRDYMNFRDGTTTSSRYGFRLTAAKHFQFKVSQEDARSIDSLEAFVTVFENFLSSGPKGFDSELAAGFIEELQTIQESLEDSQIFQNNDFVGTSLLFVHQGGVPAIRWIDFANVSSPCSEDKNGILEGIAKLKTILENSILKHQFRLKTKSPND